MPLYTTLMAHPAVPWRLRSRLERWTETRCRERLPGLYRWLRFGQVRDPMVPLSRGPMHHFFGYYDKPPWDASGRLVLAHEAEFNDRPPTAEDPVGIGVVHTEEGARFERLATGWAWNWQQGAMAQWHPADPERLFVHNDRREGAFVGVVRSVDSGEVRAYDRPIYALAPDGRQAFSLSFARLQTHRPGYGYAGVADPWAADPAPDEDGLWRIDLDSGASDLMVSVGQLARRDPREDMRGAFHYLNHIQVSPGGRRLAFFHIWRTGETSWQVRLYTVRLDGSDLGCLLDTGKVSHYDWLDDARLLVWAREPGGGDRFLLCDTETGERRVFGEGVLTEDGHCTFSPDRRWVLNDTYPDRYDLRTLMLVRWPDGRRTDIARLHSPKSRWWGEIRCDLHPRWSRDGRRVCVDSVHDGTRQMYLVDVERWVR